MWRAASEKNERDAPRFNLGDQGHDFVTDGIPKIPYGRVRLLETYLHDDIPISDRREPTLRFLRYFSVLDHRSHAIMKSFAALQALAFLQSFNHHCLTTSVHQERQQYTLQSCPPTGFMTESDDNATKTPTLANEGITTSTTVIEDASSTRRSPALISGKLPPLPAGSRRIYLLRHGETNWNLLGKIQGGGYDIPLNENGRQQASTTALALEDIPLGVIASSHLSRAKETADILWGRHNATVRNRRVILEGFGEMRFGEFEGLASRDQELDPELGERFKSISRELKQDMEKPFPGGGESTRDVETRSTAALERLLKEFPNEHHIAIVSHGRTNKVLIAAAALGDVTQYSGVKQGSKSKSSSVVVFFKDCC